jgi:hypothetical protein
MDMNISTGISESAKPRVWLTRKNAIRIASHIDLINLPEAERDSMLVELLALDPEENDEFSTYSSELQEVLLADPADRNSNDPVFNEYLLTILEMRYIGVRNEYLIGKVGALSKYDLAIAGDPEQLQPCPCCGYRTIELRGHYDICPVCFWEDDGNNNPERYSGPNHQTLAEARENVLKHGACTEGSLRSVDKEGRTKYFQHIMIKPDKRADGS